MLNCGSNYAHFMEYWHVDFCLLWQWGFSNFEFVIDYPASTTCIAPMVYFDCSTAQPGTTGTECQKSCNSLDMGCVSTNFTTHVLTEIKPLHKHALALFDPLFPLHVGWKQISTGCISGCMCPDGLVSDGSGGCIKEANCPCLHKGQVYQPGETLTVDCNTWFVQCFSSHSQHYVFNMCSLCQRLFHVTCVSIRMAECSMCVGVVSVCYETN